MPFRSIWQTTVMLLAKQSPSVSWASTGQPATTARDICFMLGCHSDMIGVLDHCLLMTVLTRKWSKGCSSVGTQDSGVGTVCPSMKVTALPGRMGRELMILSFPSAETTFPFSYWPWALVRFLMVVTALESFGKSWKRCSSCQSVLRQELRSPPSMIWYRGLESRRAQMVCLRLANCSAFFCLLELIWALMRMMLSTSRKEVLPFQSMAFFSSGASRVSTEPMFLKDERLTTMMVSWEESVTQAKLLPCWAMNASKSGEYSCRKRMSKSSLSRVAYTLANFLFSSRKDWSQNLLSVCLQI